MNVDTQKSAVVLNEWLFPMEDRKKISRQSRQSSKSNRLVISKVYHQTTIVSRKVMSGPDNFI